jgi:hypothetical protein
MYTGFGALVELLLLTPSSYGPKRWKFKKLASSFQRQLGSFGSARQDRSARFASSDLEGDGAALGQNSNERFARLPRFHLDFDFRRLNHVVLGKIVVVNPHRPLSRPEIVEGNVSVPIRDLPQHLPSIGEFHQSRGESTEWSERVFASASASQRERALGRAENHHPGSNARRSHHPNREFDHTAFSNLDVDGHRLERDPIHAE